MERFIASDLLATLYMAQSAEVTDMTDVTATVKLITVDFIESSAIDQSTIPADVAVAAAKTSADPPSLVDTPETGGKSLLWPPPEAGWNFLSLAASATGFVYGYRVDSIEGNFVGCKKFPIAIPVEDADKTIVIGEVSLPVNAAAVFFDPPAEV